jgi:hypothetical protein
MRFISSSPVQILERGRRRNETHVVQCDAQLFGLRRIEQHAFHFFFSRAQGFARDAHHGSRPQAADSEYFSRLKAA